MGVKLTPEEFLAKYGNAARKICGKYGLPASVCLAQAIIESGWDENTIGKCNCFGRKYNGEGGGFTEAWTQEYNEDVQGYVDVIAKFQYYQSAEAAIEDYCILITQDEKYESVMAVLANKEGTLGEYILTLADIYATAEKDNHAYSNLIIEIINENDLMQYDKRGVYLSARQGASFHGTDSDEGCN
ncbi:MAG: mannosyl-glycoprotein endo-beta-N-acetylglucosamidase [Bacteroidia bacterium]|nr:mannosyl-glycoprotein endo-beta-N-acetylglucosamidase [Bacteroidia bacterium]